MLKGSCLCKGVTYEVHSGLGPIIMCHCSKCRKATGTAFATNTPINTTDFKLVTGENLLSEFESTPNVFRVFCRNCGSPLIQGGPLHRKSFVCESAPSIAQSRTSQQPMFSSPLKPSGMK